MSNPSGFPHSGSYVNMQKRVIEHLQSAKVDDQIFETLQEAYEKELTRENIVLTRLERSRLLSQVVKAILTDMLSKIDGVN